MLGELALVIFSAKVFGILARRINVPQVAGEIVAGLIIGPSVLNWVQNSDFLSGMAEIGVIILMFTAGLETNISQLRRTGLKATLIAMAGVCVPMALGTWLFMTFYGFAPAGSDQFYKALFIGTILSATSVSITVEALRELGKMSGLVGTTIVSAAVIDDVIGIIALTIVLGFRDPSTNLGSVLINIGLFFVFAFGVGYLIYRLFKLADKRYPHTRRIPIAGLALSFAMAFVAEKVFGIADVTGAYVAGVILSSIDDSDYITRKMDVNSYMIFGPIFFASIGLQTNMKQLDSRVLIFSLAFVAVGLIGKIVGCGLMARLCRFNWEDSLKIGCGMMTRGEVALIVSQKGLSVGMMEPEYFTAVILLIVISSIMTPIVLKRLYARDPQPTLPEKDGA